MIFNYKRVLEPNSHKNYKRNVSSPPFSETWISLNEVARKLVFHRKSLHKLKIALIENIKKVQSIYTGNVRCLSPKCYFDLWEMICDFHLSFDEAYDLCKGTLSEKYFSDAILKRGIDKCRRIMKSQKEGVMINRGLQAMFLMLTDKKFCDYEKYFIGHHGLDQVFRHGNDHYNQFAEYRLITEWVKKGLIKYLPEHINSYKWKGISAYGYD